MCNQISENLMHQYLSDEELEKQKQEQALTDKRWQDMVNAMTKPEPVHIDNKPESKSTWE